MRIYRSEPIQICWSSEPNKIFLYVQHIISRSPAPQHLIVGINNRSHAAQVKILKSLSSHSRACPKNGWKGTEFRKLNGHAWDGERVKTFHKNGNRNRIKPSKPLANLRS
jgi:hypothetical protein